MYLKQIVKQLDEHLYISDIYARTCTWWGL